MEKNHSFFSKQTLTLELKAHDHEWGCGRTYPFQDRRLQTWDNSTEAWASKVAPHAPDEPGGASAPIPGHWLLLPLRQEGLTTFLSLETKPFASSLPNPKFSMDRKGAFMARGFSLSLLPPESMDNPRPPPGHPPEAQADFLSKGSSPCPPWWAEAPKSKIGS